MIKVSKLSYSYPQKDLYNDVSFEIEKDSHCALIGSNGTGKSTLIDMIMNGDEYLYDGKIEISDNGKIGYVSQFSQLEDKVSQTVFEYISEEFVKLEKRIADLCDKMASSEDLDTVFDEYQDALDESLAIDCDHYDSNIKKQLKVANIEKLETQSIDSISGGEFKLVQVIREMLLSPKMLIMDEPDVFLDFEHLNALKDLINSYKGTIIVITHNRYLLNHCFNKILHLEDTNVLEFDGTYNEYNLDRLNTKIELLEIVVKEEEEIERQSKIVDKVRAEATAMDNASLGKRVHARQTLLDRLISRKTKGPYVEIKQPEIEFAYKEDVEDIEDIEEVENLEDEVKCEDEAILTLTDYSVAFDEQLLSDVNFELGKTDKVAIVGENGTGKTTLLKEICANNNDAINIRDSAQIVMFSQSGPTVTLDANTQKNLYEETKTIIEVMEDNGFERRDDIEEYMIKYGFEGDALNSMVRELSGGEKDLLQLALIALKESNLMLLDEPTGHLDVYSQIALEKAISQYKGAILMVSHDFYTVANSMDYVLFVENNTVRRMSIRKFRQMIYAKHFDKDYLLLEQRKKELETRVELLLQKKDFEATKPIMEELEEVVKKMK